MFIFHILFYWLLLLIPISKAEEIKVWHAYKDAEAQVLKKLMLKYEEANPDVTISILEIPDNAFKNKLESAAPMNNGPDLFISAHNNMGHWIRSGLIAEVDFDPKGLHPITVEALTYDGKRYGVPLAFKCLSLILNEDLLSQPPKTTDELIQISKVLRANNTTKPNFYPLAYESTTSYYHAIWMHGYGGSFFDKDGVVALDSEENKRSLQFMQTLKAENIIPPEPEGSLITQLFNGKNAAMVISGPWFLGSIQKGLRYSIHPLPLVSDTNEPASPFLTVEGAFVSKYSKKQKRALEVASFLVETSNATMRAVEGRQSVATTEAYQDPKLQSDVILQSFYNQLNASIPMPSTPETDQIWEPLARAIRRVDRGSHTPEEALTAARQEYERLTKPPPPPANPTPYIIVGSIIFLGIVGWLIKSFVARRKEIFANKYAYAYIAPAAIAMLLLSVLPFVVGAGVSLFYHENNEFTFVGLANFTSILFAKDWPLTSSLSFYFTLFVTILWTVLNVILHVSIGIALALLLREPWLKLRAVYRVLLILPWAIPNYITAFIWKGMFNYQFGAVNALLENFGVERVSWFSQFTTSFTANLLTNTWLGFPFMMVVTLGALQSIDRDLEAAASVDGATGWQRFRYITLPLLKPALLPAVVLGSVWTFNMFNIIYLVSAGEPDSATDILISDAYHWAFTRGYRYGYAAAYAVLIFFILFPKSFSPKHLTLRPT